MMANQEGISKPRLLFDTNVLYRFAPYFGGFDLKKILTLCNTLDIKPCTTELVIKKLHQLCKEDIDQRRNTILGNLKHLKGNGMLETEHATILLKEHKINLTDFLKKRWKS